MRIPLCALALTMVAGCFLSAAFGQQRVFSASPIDEIQDDKIAELQANATTFDKRLSQIEAAMNSQAATLDLVIGAVKVLSAGRDKVAMAPVAKPQVAKPLSEKPLPPQSVGVASYSQPPSLASARYTRAELEAIVAARYPTGFQVRYADVSPRTAVWNHLKAGVHGFSSSQVDGMSQWVALALHDMHHGGEITPFKRRAATVQRSVAQSQPRVQQASPYFRPMTVSYAGLGGGCANGRCARPAYVMRIWR